MAVSENVLRRVIETSLFLMPEVPRRFEHLKISGIQGRVTPLSHPLVNLVGLATFNADQAETTIRQVYDCFAAQKKAFGWVIGPSAPLPDLRERLVAAGLAKVEEMAGMTLTDLQIPIRTNPAVQIREATGDELMAASDMLARAYGLPAEVARLVNEITLLGRDQIRSRGYLAYVPECVEPVAMSYLVYIPGQPIVLLGGAATLAAYRGQGIYSSFVARRLADAKADGAEAVVIQAVRSTSAPICAKLGFREICGLELYAWMPEVENVTQAGKGLPIKRHS